MTDSQQDDAFRRLVQRIDPRARLLRTRRLTGGVSAEITVLEVARSDGETTKLLVRRHGDSDRAHNPHIAMDEFRLLEIAQAHALAAPEPYYVDESCDLFPTPVLVVEYIEGEADFAPTDLAGYLSRVVAELVKIHEVKETPDLSFLPRQDKGFGARPADLDTSLSEDRIRAALESASPLSQVNESGLLHGDYWPGNILWRNGKLAAVIDWEDARIGDPLADLANCRLELLWWFGAAAMDDFTDRYRSLARIDLTNLPFWDLCAALRPCGKLSNWGLDEATERRMRALHSLFVSRARELLKLQ
ncbi:MAG TPA: phosphotransferase [Thermomicrobiales bacterium]|jgi:aminoglycoside phosphotransferase (APT) family kinase protein